MGSVFYLVGIVLAGIAGYSNLPWYFIFISSLTMAIGYSIIRAPQIHSIISRDGAGAILKVLLMQIIIYSIVTSPIYFAAGFLN